MYLDIHGESVDAIADALDDIKECIRDGNQFGNGVYYGEIVAWKLNVNQR